MTGKAIERLDRLKRRAEHLEARVANGGEHLSHDIAEASALRWAIEIIEDWMPNDEVRSIGKTERIAGLQEGLIEAIAVAQRHGMSQEDEHRLRRYLHFGEAAGSPLTGGGRWQVS